MYLLGQFDIGFVILTWNSERYIRTCIESIFSLSDLHVIICVVDNGSSDQTTQILEDLRKESIPQSMEMDIIRLNKIIGQRSVGI